MKCWGNNSNGQLTPTAVSGLGAGVTAVSVGGDPLAGYHACALTGSGGVKCWGENQFGQLGDGTTTNRPTPVDVIGLTSGVVAVAAGDGDSCALTSTGGVKCWGANEFGQLGDGTFQPRPTPVDIVGLTSGVVALSVGTGHTCAVTTAGGLECWGVNESGELGDGTTTNRLTPVAVMGLSSGVAAVSVGYLHTCAVMTTGAAQCWGNNIRGQLGDGTTTNRLTPVAVSGLGSGVSAISAGYAASCAVTTAGGAECWGYQPGDGTTSQLAPVSVPGLSSGVAVVSAGEATSTLHGRWGAEVLGLQLRGSSRRRHDDGPADACGCVRLVLPQRMPDTGRFGPHQLRDERRIRRRLDGGLHRRSGLCTGRIGHADLPGRPHLDAAVPTATAGCPPLVAAPHTGFTLSNGLLLGSTATFVADLGYSLVGSNQLTCQGGVQSGGTWSGPVPTATALPTPRVVPGVSSVVEGDSGTVALHVPVTLSNPSAQTVTVPWTTVYLGGRLWQPGRPGHRLHPGHRARSPSRPVRPPRRSPSWSTVTPWSNPTSTSSCRSTTRPTPPWAASADSASVPSLNDDHATVVPGSGIVAAPTSGTADLAVSVTLTNPSTVAITVQWTTLFVPGNPTDPWLGPQAPTSDYVASSGTVTFAPGQTTAEVHIPVTGRQLTRARRIHRRLLPPPHQRHPRRLLGTRLRHHHPRALTALGRPREERRCAIRGAADHSGGGGRGSSGTHSPCGCLWRRR